MENGESVVIIRPSRFRLKYIRPCMTDRQKRMAEISLEVKPDAYAMCDLLAKHFKDVSCSPKDGVARIQEGGMVIMVFDSGKVVIRQAKDEESVLQAVEKVSLALHGQ